MPNTLCITVFHSFVARNLLYGDMLDTLARNGVRTVLLVPTHKREYFVALFKDKTVEIEGVDTEALATRPRNLFLSRLSFLLIRSHYLWYKRVERRDAGGFCANIKYVFEQIFVSVFAHSWVRPFFRALVASTADCRVPEVLLAHIRPTLLFVTDAFNPADQLFLLAAHKLGFDNIAMVRSWDNCYSKGLLSVMPRRLLVNTPHLKQEAAGIHGVPTRSIEVVGLPQFDFFFTSKPLDREEFMRTLGADAARKLIVFAPAGTVLADTDWQICDMLRAAMRKGEIRQPVHVLVRNHPNHPADLSQFEHDPDFTIEYPGRRFGENLKETEMTWADQLHLRDTVANADVLLWVATTLPIDASAFGRPQIMVNFDGNEKKAYLQSVRKYHDEDHMKKLVSTGGAHVARSREELVEWINNYLADPSLDAEGRKKMQETQMVFIDGRSGERVTRALLECLG